MDRLGNQVSYIGEGADKIMFINEETYKGSNYEVASLIQRRRLQILVHSRIYYSMDKNIITDQQFDALAYELVQLQKDYPEQSKEVEFYEDFKDWDGNTGAFLNLDGSWVINQATKQLQLYTGGTKNDQKKDKHKDVLQRTGKESSKKVKRKKTTKLGRNSLF